MPIYGEKITTEEVALCLRKDTNKITASDITYYISMNSKEGRSQAEKQAQAFLETCKDKFGLGISTKIIIFNPTGYTMKFKTSRDWSGSMGTDIDKEIAPGQYSALFHHKTRGVACGSVGCLVYSLVDEDNQPVKEIFFGWQNPHEWGSPNRIYTEVREPGHWFGKGSEERMLSLVEHAHETKIERGESGHDVVEVSGSISDGSTVDVRFKVTKNAWNASLINNSGATVSINGLFLDNGQHYSFSYHPAGLSIDVPNIGLLQLLEPSNHDYKKHVNSTWAVVVIAGGSINYCGYDDQPTFNVLLNNDSTFSVQGYLNSIPICAPFWNKASVVIVSTDLTKFGSLEPFFYPAIITINIYNPIPSVEMSRSPQIWDITPVRSTDFNQGYLLSNQGNYLTSKTLYDARRGGYCLIASDKIEDAAKVMPILTYSNSYYLRLLGTTDQVLTMYTGGYVMRFATLQNADGYPYFQRFTTDNNIKDDTRLYYWICNKNLGHTLEITDPDSNQNMKIISRPMRNSDSQLFRLQNVPNSKSYFYLVSKLNGYVLDASLSTSSPGNALVVKPPSSSNYNSQSWSFINGYLACILNNYVITWQATTNSNVLASTKLAPLDNSQQCCPMFYSRSPDISKNQFENLQPGTQFTIYNLKTNKVLTWLAASNHVKIQARNLPVTTNQLWTYSNGHLTNLAANQILTANDQGNLNLIVPSNPQPSQNWQFTSDGLLLNAENINNVVIADNSTEQIFLVHFDPAGMVSEYWTINLVQANSLVNASLSKFSVHTISTNVDYGSVIKALKVKIVMSDDWFAGTSDTIMVTFQNDEEHWQTVLESPSRGDSREITVNLNDMFPSEIVKFQDLTSISLGYLVNSPGVITDKGKIASIVITATDSNDNIFYNNTFLSLNEWINPRYRNIFHWNTPISWTGFINWAAWSDQNQKPIDLNLKTYSVTLLPWISDLLHWRSYDPSSIDGVGMLVGKMNGKIIGNLLKSRKLEELAPGAYTWVYVPESNSIIYKYWSKEDERSNYTRHSQLASGNPVICAGEFQISSQKTFLGFEDIIVMVNDASGHYKPDGGSCLKYVMQKFQSLGFSTDQTKMYWRDFPLRTLSSSANSATSPPSVSLNTKNTNLDTSSSSCVRRKFSTLAFFDIRYSTSLIKQPNSKSFIFGQKISDLNRSDKELFTEQVKQQTQVHSSMTARTKEITELPCSFFPRTLLEDRHNRSKSICSTYLKPFGNKVETLPTRKVDVSWGREQAGNRLNFFSISRNNQLARSIRNLTQVVKGFVR